MYHLEFRHIFHQSDWDSNRVTLFARHVVWHNIRSQCLVAAEHSENLLPREESAVLFQKWRQTLSQLSTLSSIKEVYRKRPNGCRFLCLTHSFIYIFFQSTPDSAQHLYECFSNLLFITFVNIYTTLLRRRGVKIKITWYYLLFWYFNILFWCIFMFWNYTTTLYCWKGRKT